MKLILFQVVVGWVPEKQRDQGNKSAAPKMIKSLAALAVFALLGASVTASPTFAPEVKAREATALGKGDRLEVLATNSNCLKQVWPDFAASCLRTPGSAARILEALLVTVRR